MTLLDRRAGGGSGIGCAAADHGSVTSRERVWCMGVERVSNVTHRILIWRSVNSYVEKRRSECSYVAVTRYPWGILWSPSELNVSFSRAGKSMEEMKKVLLLVLGCAVQVGCHRAGEGRPQPSGFGFVVTRVALGSGGSGTAFSPA